MKSIFHLFGLLLKKPDKKIETGLQKIIVVINFTKTFNMTHTETYHETLHKITRSGLWREDPNREGVRRLQIPFVNQVYDIETRFPLLTTKKMWWKGIVVETLWTLSGETNIKPLLNNGVYIWSKDAYNYYLKKHKETCPDKKIEDEEYITFFIKKENEDHWFSTEDYRIGDIGRMYGVQWRSWDGKIDQLKNVIEQLKTNPNSSNHVIFGDNPSDRNKQALPCCMNMIQFVIESFNDETYLDMVINYRSWDYLLGAPWNIAQYALIQSIVANITGYEAGNLIINASNVHLYDNQIDAAKEQLERESRRYISPKLSIKKKLTLEDLHPDNWELFEIEDYKSYPKLENQPPMISYS